jgi:hypothetical protein
VRERGGHEAAAAPARRAAGAFPLEQHDVAAGAPPPLPAAPPTAP